MKDYYTELFSNNKHDNHSAEENENKILEVVENITMGVLVRQEKVTTGLGNDKWVGKEEEMAFKNPSVGMEDE